jgi:branched-chain amino acid transport system permease protein
MNIEVALFSGLTLGALYCLMAMGLTLVNSTIKFFNFSHGAILMTGSYFTWYLLEEVGLNYLASFIVTLLMTFILGVVVQRVIVQPLVNKEASGLMLILGTFVIGNLLENGFLLIFGGRLKRLPTPLEGHFSIGAATITYHSLLILLTTSVVMGGMAYFLLRTRMGMAMRCVAQNEQAAQLMGIPVKTVYRYVLGISSLLAGVAGVFLGSIYFMTPSMGGGPLSKAFTVCVLGGLNSIFGTVVGAFLVGLLESTLTLFFPMYYVTPALFLLMMLILLVRPEGIFS